MHNQAHSSRLNARNRTQGAQKALKQRVFGRLVDLLRNEAKIGLKG